MSGGVGSEQRNPYKGSPPRSWIRIILVAADGTKQPVELVADSGCPYEVVVAQSLMGRFGRRGGPTVYSNFGALTGGWLEVAIPELNFDETLAAFASDAIAATTSMSCPDFEGLAGLPFLRRFNYGGDDQAFWLRTLSSTP